MNNVSPTIKGEQILLRKPKESDVIDRFRCGRSKELIRMYGGDTRNFKPFTKEEATEFIQKILSNKLEWCGKPNR